MCVSIGEMRIRHRRTGALRCTGARKSPRLPREARVDPTCASENLLANRLINRRLDLELMQGHIVSREQKVVAVGGGGGGGGGFFIGGGAGEIKERIY